MKFQSIYFCLYGSDYRIMLDFTVVLKAHVALCNHQLWLLRKFITSSTLSKRSSTRFKTFVWVHRLVSYHSCYETLRVLSLIWCCRLSPLLTTPNACAFSYNFKLVSVLTNLLISIKISATSFSFIGSIITSRQISNASCKKGLILN